MKKIKLIKTVNYLYPRNDLKFETLIDFLLTEVGNHTDSFIDFINNSTSAAISCNIYFLEKTNKNIIIDDLLHDSDEDHEDRVVMHKDYFIEMLEQWEKVYSQQPDEIIITQDDAGKISITGKFADGREI